MKKIFSLASVAIMALSINAQNLLLEEYFEYEAGTNLITDTITLSDNMDGVTGWSTSSNKNSGQTRFTIADAPLTYEGYAGSGIAVHSAIQNGTVRIQELGTRRIERLDHLYRFYDSVPQAGGELCKS